MNFEGWWSDGQSAARHAVRIRVQGPKLVLTDPETDGLVAELPADGLSLAEEVYRGQPLRFRHAKHPDAMLTVSDHALLERVLPHAPQLRRRYLARSTTLQRFAGWGLALVVVVGGMLAAVHLGTGPAAALVPDEWESAMGERMVSSIAKEDGQCSDDAGRRALDALTATLADAARSDYRFHVTVLDDGAVNAFAAPGGHIGLYRGLIEKADSPDEVAGVLAHEMAHVIERHPTEGLIRQVGYRAVFAALLGDASSAMELAGAAGETLINRAHSRAAEREADRLGLTILHRAELDAAGLAAFFQRLREDKGEVPESLTWLSTHPATDERIAIARARAKEGKSALSSAQWEALRGVCEKDEESQD